MEVGHIELHKMLVYVKTKAYAPYIKIFQVLYTTNRDITATCVTTQNTEIFVNNHGENLVSFIAYLNGAVRLRRLSRFQRFCSFPRLLDNSPIGFHPKTLVSHNSITIFYLKLPKNLHKQLYAQICTMSYYARLDCSRYFIPRILVLEWDFLFTFKWNITFWFHIPTWPYLWAG